MSDAIKAALQKLEPENDAHWTSDNLPRLDVMKNLVGAEITRADIQAVSKTFNRKNLNLDEQPSSAPDTAATPEIVAKAEDNTVEGSTEAEPQIPSSVPEDVVKAAEAEYEKASKLLVAAQRRFKEAQEIMDQIVSIREQETKRQTFAQTVKQYQESQRKLREGMITSSQYIAEAARALQSKGKA